MESTRKKVLDAALKALLSAKETQWWLNLPATFIAELSPKLGDLTDEERTVLVDATPGEIHEALTQIGLATEYAAYTATGIDRIERCIAEISQGLLADSEEAARRLADVRQRLPNFVHQAFELGIRLYTYSCHLQGPSDIPFSKSNRSELYGLFTAFGLSTAMLPDSLDARGDIGHLATDVAHRIKTYANNRASCAFRLGFLLASVGPQPHSQTIAAIRDSWIGVGFETPLLDVFMGAPPSQQADIILQLANRLESSVPSR